MPHPSQYLENSPEYQEEQESTGIEDKFDWHAISMLCVEAIPKHKAYGMMFEEYRKRRESVLEEDTTERKRLSFYIPAFPSAISVAYAVKYKCSFHRFILLTVELGLIKFQYDYHDDYSAIKNIRGGVLDKIVDKDSVEQFTQMADLEITLGSCASFRNSKGKHFTPSVPEWLYNALSDVSIYLGMSMSDVAFLCFCIGLINSTSPDLENIMVKKYCNAVCDTFDLKLKKYKIFMSTCNSGFSL